MNPHPRQQLCRDNFNDAPIRFRCGYDLIFYMERIRFNAFEIISAWVYVHACAYSNTDCNTSITPSV